MKHTIVMAAIVTLIASVGGEVASRAAGPVELNGYVAMSDEVQLHYTVDLPDASGRFPVAFNYDPYCAGEGTLSCNDPISGAALLAAGYAVLGVSIRGTACSGGTFDLLSHLEATDGAAVVEWAANQPWSDGNVGMFGLSYPGISQLEVAAQQPAHLRAISPFQVVADAYRDVVYPGGIFNSGFAALWSFLLQPESSYGAAATGAQRQDVTCQQNIAEHAATEPSGNTYFRVSAQAFDDAYWTAREPGSGAANIDVPVLACDTWQDDAVSSRAGDSYFNALDPSRTWIVMMNGYHGLCERSLGTSANGTLVRFFDRFVKGINNGFEATPHVQLWHETQLVSSVDTPRWITTYASWSVPVTAVALSFSGYDVLTTDQSSGMPDDYAYPLPAASTEGEENTSVGQTNALWKAPGAPGGALAYTTPALSNDAEFFGTGSADIWLSSSATDTDLQITLTEVRPDGQEIYVQRGWLRASHRALDASRSTELLPVQTHLESDAQPLVPGAPTLMRVELFPFDHVFRTGSSIRLWVDAPTGETGFWSLDFLKTPAVNSIWHDAAHPSRLVLGLVPGGRAQQAPLPACDSLLNQPCRPNLIPVPPGKMTTDAAVSVPVGE